MTFLQGKCYTEVEDKRYFVYPTESKILRERKEPTKLRTQNQVMIETLIGGNQKAIKIQIDEMEVKSYPKNEIKQKVEKTKVDVECP